MQAYALARPAVRLRLHVLKARNNQVDFVYAPKANANVEDAALKIIDKGCASQFDWTAIETDGFELHAFLPKPKAIGSKVATNGAFISVDSRPVSSIRGTLKKVAIAVRDKIRKANMTLAKAKNPFFCLNILCPVDSYDPNIEPAKDDVIFADEPFMITLIDRLLVSYYPENNVDADLSDRTEVEDVSITQSIHMPNVEEALSQPCSPLSVPRDPSAGELGLPRSSVVSKELRWRSSMYGIDEEDLEFLKGNVPAVVEEEEGCRDIAISNPWTFARMNAPIKSNKLIDNGQFPSPAKSQNEASTAPQSPAPAATPHRPRLVESLTPQTSPQAHMSSGRIGTELQPRNQSGLRCASDNNSVMGPGSNSLMFRAPKLACIENGTSTGFVQATSQRSVPEALLMGSVAPRRKRRSQQPFRDKPFVRPASHSDDTWFGQPMYNAPEATHSKKRPRKQDLPFFSGDDAFKSQGSLVLPVAGRLVEATPASENNSDIRDFFGQLRCAPPDLARTVGLEDTQPRHVAEQLRAYAERESPIQSSPCRPRSAESYPHPTDTAREMNALFQLHQSTSPGPYASYASKGGPSDIIAALKSYPRPQRRRTTDGGLRRTKSSTLPLNFVPQGCETRNLILPTNTSVLSIIHQARKLDMAANSLEWGYDTTDAFDVFAKPASERKIVDWVLRIDDLLHTVFERVDGVEVLDTLHESIQRFLDTRKVEPDGTAPHAAVAVTIAPFPSHPSTNTHIDDCGIGLLEHSLQHQAADGESNNGENGARYKPIAATIKSDEYSKDFDLDGREGEQPAPVRDLKTEDFGDDIDDEMLMDL